MANYSNYEIQRLAERARAQIELDEKYARERQEAYETKKQLRIYEIIIEVVQPAYGWVTQDIVEQVRSLLHIE